jgi:hypothetical protein
MKNTLLIAAIAAFFYGQAAFAWVNTMIGNVKR